MADALQPLNRSRCYLGYELGWVLPEPCFRWGPGFPKEATFGCGGNSRACRELTMDGILTVIH